MTVPSGSHRCVAVVTDSTAYLPPALADVLGVAVVPLHVVIDGKEYAESDVPPSTVAEALRRHAHVTTSRAAPEELGAAYRKAAAQPGVVGIVSVHLSAHMSGTHDAALLAARKSPAPVRVVDSGSLGMGLGFAVLAAVAAADEGENVDRVAEAAARTAAATRVLFYVDTLEHLRRGGRIGAARALVGSALAVKPLLHISDGRIEPLEKVRTAAKALARLEELAVHSAAEGAVDIAVQHLEAPARAHDLAHRLRERVPAARDVHVVEVGAVIGAHVGPGMLAVVVAPS